MDSTLEGKKCLAAIALFGELAKKGLDVYSTLAEFISYCISNSNLYKFSLFEIKEALYVQFGFSIPEIVIKNAIKKIPNIVMDNHNYLVEKSVKLKETLNEKRLEIEESHNKILSEINNYISNILKKDLSETEKNDIYDTFFALLIQKKSVSNLYSKYISAFIIENEHNEDIIKKLNIIYEGVLIYSAFQYTPEEYSKNTWTENLVLYFDTELLFSLYGLNGKLYQAILEELFDLIRTINKKELDKKTIELRYFDETEQEIDSYFKIAGSLIQSNGTLEFQQRTAMLSILNGCQDITQVMEKKALFFQKLKYFGFEEDKYQYYNENDYQYNILDEEGRNLILKEFPLHESKRVDENLKYLNKIAILRRGKNSTRRSSKYFFVTATTICLNIANNSQIIRTDSVPLTTTVEYLTEKFWIKMNKNFSKINLLNSNVVIKAQLIINAQLGIAITEKTNELGNRYKNIDLECANAIYSEVKKIRNYSEEVNQDNIGQIIYFTEESIDNFIDKYNYEKEEAEKTRKENVQLKSINNDMVNRLSFFEKREERKMKIINAIRNTFRIIFFVILIALPIALIIFAQINKAKYPILGTYLSIFASIGTLLSICNFVNHLTGFIQKLKNIFRKYGRGV